MGTTKRRLWSIKRELLVKSREAALSAIKTFNDPLITFKTEAYIVLMIIAWTYLLHAYYRSKGIEYRHHDLGKNGRKLFHRTSHGAYKYWELERCLNNAKSPIDADTANNLRFLIGLRHEIEHQMSQSLDSYLSGRYQACAINYNEYAKSLFGPKQGLDQHLTFSIQLLALTETQLDLEGQLPSGLGVYVMNFDNSLTFDEFNSPRFSVRLLFTKKLVNHPGQADRVIEFIDSNSDLAKSIDKERWVKKEVERPKFRAKQVAAAIQQAGFSKFRVQREHVVLWKAHDAKNPSKGYGVEIQGEWFWYEGWIKKCLEICAAAGDKYR